MTGLSGAEAELLGALRRFETKITVSAMGAGADLLRRAASRDVKIAYYLAGVSSTVTWLGGPKITFHVKYKDTDVRESDVYVVSSGEEVDNLLCRYIGDYKTRLVLFAGKGVDVEAEYHRFSETKSTFYANFVGVRRTRGKSSLTDMPYYDFLFDYRIGKVKLTMMENEVDAEVERIARQLFLPGMSDVTKAFLAHNYLAHTVTYTLREDASSLETSYMQSAYGALIRKKCVCQGYAEAFKRLMDVAGVPCDVVRGQIRSSAVYHAWNMIRLHDGAENYHIDVTWDSDGERVSYTYFGLSDAALTGERTWNRAVYARCDSDTKLLPVVRREIMRFKSGLIANGADPAILGY